MHKWFHDKQSVLKAFQTEISKLDTQKNVVQSMLEVVLDKTILLNAAEDSVSA